MLISLINDSHVQKKVTISGRIYNIRSGKAIIFIEIYDKNIFTPIQIIAFKNKTSLFQKFNSLRFHDYVCVSGIIATSSKNKYEMHALAIKILNSSTETVRYLLQPKKQSAKFLRSIESIRLRVKLYQAIFQIRNEIEKSINIFLCKHNFTNVTAPVITPFDAEGAGEVFKLDGATDFFGKPGFLTVSSQFYAESMAQTFNNVYVFGPTFRADKSKTTRHAAEFWMLEPEWITNNLEEILDFSENLIKYIAKKISEKCLIQLKYCSEYYRFDLTKRINLLIKQNFVRINYSKAIDDLNKFNIKKRLNKQSNLVFGHRISKQEELILCNDIYQNAVFITNYPTKQKAFYMQLNSDNLTVSSVDLLFPDIGEIIGGSLREPIYKNLINHLQKKQLSSDLMKWYLELRKQKYVQTGGFGLGLARIVMYFTGSPNIKDVIFFPRSKGHLQT